MKMILVSGMRILNINQLNMETFFSIRFNLLFLSELFIIIIITLAQPIPP